MASSAEKLTFPVFPITDLVNFLKQSILTGTEAKSLAKNDLYPNPKAEVVQRIYMRVLMEVFNYSMEQFFMVPMSLDTQYPQLLEGFAAISNIAKLMWRESTSSLLMGYNTKDVEVRE
ncbi:kinetochore protein Nuf2-B-like [Bombina bombina]|uniref:kinetochore protein Nuf2-B-like n=1 Tax=Bombina bombina TaxID=8345 RepID=UPI00235B1F49|nr:kinetochore protein Nuf2-B-like [Bombina bombina]